MICMGRIMTKTALLARSRNGNGRNGHSRNGNGNGRTGNGNGSGRNGNGHGRNSNGRGPATAEHAAQDVKNYITPQGYARLRAELLKLHDVERPDLVKTISWAASNGDRSENGDYLYGKRRLREIDRRIRYLMKRLDIAEVVDPRDQPADQDQVFFGATVTYVVGTSEERTISIVGIDEADASRGRVSWISPIAKALFKAREGDVIALRTPGGIEEIELLDVRYIGLD